MYIDIIIIIFQYYNNTFHYYFIYAKITLHSLTHVREYYQRWINGVDKIILKAVVNGNLASNRSMNIVSHDERAKVNVGM